MSFDWTHYLEVARLLMEDRSGRIDEAAKMRSAISRAYYAVFNTAVQYMKQKNNVKNLGENSHKFVQEWFEKSAFEDETAIGEMLYQLKGRRVRADYRANYPKLKEQAETSITIAENALSLFKNL